MKKILLTFLILISIVACGKKKIETKDPVETKGSLEIENPYVRLLPPNTPNTGAFLKIKNTTGEDRKLISAESDICEKVELHTHIKNEKMMKMRKVENVPIPNNAGVELKPGSYHIMLMKLKKDLTEGQKVTIKLTFDNNTQKTIQAEVKKMSPMKK
jgi:hypothetical protein